MKLIRPATFFDKLLKQSEIDKPFKLFPHQREILRLAFDFDQNGKLPWDTILYSCCKKSGKSAINAALTLWWALCEEPNNELLVVANDLEQALSRVYRAIEGLVDHNSALKAECDVQSRTIYLENGSTIKAISSDYAGAAGSNHGWVSVDELWAVSSAAGRRLWDELTPVPTRKNSVRFVSTYAGFTNESELLEELYQKAVVEGERIHDELPIYVNRPARIFAYWDHERRMPWQLGAEGEQYYEAQRRTLRPATFARLHQRVDVFRIEIH